MWMQLDCDDFRLGIAIRDGQGFSAGSRTAIQDSLTRADQCRHKLRSFILNGDAAFSKSASLGHVSGDDAPCMDEKNPRLQLDASAAQLLLHIGSAQADR